MLVDVRPVDRLRGAKAVNVTPTIGAVLDALARSDIDLHSVRMVCDWIQYKANFRSPIDLRPIVADPGSSGAGTVEVAVDLRRAAETDPDEWRAMALSAIERYRSGQCDDVFLEDWAPTSRSCVWEFNALYWRALEHWEKATGRLYEQALPGGESDARNVEAVRELIGGLFKVWDGLAERKALPAELYVIELGVGNGHQAKVWLDEFRKMDAAHGRDYYRRLHYLLCDYSPHVLEMARTTVRDHAEHVSAFVLDATEPSVALGFLGFKVFLVYVSNVYDNLPSDEVARFGGAAHLIEARAYLPGEVATELANEFGVPRDALARQVQRLLRLGPELLAEASSDLFDSVETVMRFWQRVWAELRLAERYVPLRGLDVYEVAPGVSGEALRPMLEAGDDIRLHVNNGAVASFVDTLRLLHPYGTLVAHDLFVTDVDAYRSAYRGPGKYEGSVVNWNNGPLLAAVGRRRGFDVAFRPFAFRTGTNIVTLTAEARD